MAEISKIQPFGSSTQYDLRDTSKLPLSGGTMTGDITLSSGAEILALNAQQILRMTSSTTDNNSTGCSWYGIGRYNVDEGTTDAPAVRQWFNISNYWGINITTRGHTYLRHNGNVLLSAGNYNDYVPTKTGGGASGSWGINITGSSASCTGNAATATKATQDSDGNQINTTYLKLSGGTMTGLLTAKTDATHMGIKLGNTYLNAITDQVIFQNNKGIRFGADNWDWNTWAGLKYAHDSKTISLGLADGTVFNANSAQSGGILQFPGINIVRLTNNTGGIYKLYSSASTAPFLQINSNNLDVSVLKIDGNDPTDIRDSQSYGFNLKYIGTGSGAGNTLRLYSDNSDGTDQLAMEWSGDGKVGIGTTYNSSYRLYVNGTSYFNNTLNILSSTAGNYNEGIRLHSASNSWDTIILCGPDNTGDSGTSAKTWLIGNYDGNFYISKNGSNGASTLLKNVDNVWSWNGTASGNISGNADTATKIASTPNNTTVFLRGDNTWSNALTGDLNVSGYFNSVKIKYSPINNATTFATSGIVDMFGVTDNTNGKLAVLRTAASAPDSLRNNYASGIAWKGADTYGALTVAYGAPNVKIAGGNGSNPVWWFGLDATSGKTYTLPTDSKTLCATDGSNASGTWGISISGNAATATKATNATNDKDGNQIDTTYTKKSELLDLVYPIGAIYISATSTSPATLFGGTWAQIGGRFLLSADETYEAGTTGGSATVTLETANLPSHTHSVGAHAHSLNAHTHSVGAHAHSLNAHTHAGPSHTHTGPSHTHTGPSHTHSLSSHYHWVGPQNGSTSGAGGHTHSTNGTWIVYDTGGWATRWGPSIGDNWTPLYDNNPGSFTSNPGNHSHSVSTNAVNSGGPSNNTSGAGGTGATGAAGTGATGASGTGATGGPSVANTGNSTAFNSGGPSTTNTGNSTAFNSGATGSGTAHNNMPPYLTVYMWQRTA